MIRLFGRKAVASRGVTQLARPRYFSVYVGKDVKDDELVKKSDDWVIEETNFCLGRATFTRYREEDDLARRALHAMESNLNQLRDGTVIPFTAFQLDGTRDRPSPGHSWMGERPLFKYTWDETYDEAYEDPDVYRERLKKQPRLRMENVIEETRQKAKQLAADGCSVQWVLPGVEEPPMVGAAEAEKLKASKGNDGH